MTFRCIVKLTALLAASLVTASSCATEAEVRWAGKAAKVDALFSAYANKSSPGCAVAVVAQGQVIHQGLYGMANLEHNVPISAESVFRVGSISKQFTAAAVALLADQGRVDLDADVHRYLPELIDYDRPVTLRQMIAHTAAMQDYSEAAFDPIALNIAGESIRWGNEDYLSIEEFYSLVAQVPLLSQPQGRFEYSNLGYFLLSQVVERVTGESLAKFSQREIFSPLNMTHTIFNDNVNQLIPGRADGYKVLEKGGYERFTTNLSFVGDGGVFTSLNDFYHWDQSFYQPLLGTRPDKFVAGLQQPLAQLSDEDGQPLSGSFYAFGQFVTDSERSRFYSHTGGWVGFGAFYERHPQQQLSFFGFCNRDDADVAQHMVAIRAIYLGG